MCGRRTQLPAACRPCCPLSLVCRPFALFSPADTPPLHPPAWLADGPWFDSAKFVATKNRYIVDLGMDPTITQLKLSELENDEFLSPATRRVALSLTLYNK